MSVWQIALPREAAYLASQRPGRPATAGGDGKPHVVPTSFRHNTGLGTIDIGGFRFAERKTWRDVVAKPHAVFVVDDQLSVDPWVVRILTIRMLAAPPSGV